MRYTQRYDVRLTTREAVYVELLMRPAQKGTQGAARLLATLDGPSRGRCVAFRWADVSIMDTVPPHAAMRARLSIIDGQGRRLPHPGRALTVPGLLDRIELCWRGATRDRAPRWGLGTPAVWPAIKGLVGQQARDVLHVELLAQRPVYLEVRLAAKSLSWLALIDPRRRSARAFRCAALRPTRGAHARSGRVKATTWKALRGPQTLELTPISLLGARGETKIVTWTPAGRALHVCDDVASELARLKRGR